jgi:tetratricopeptide (TPR) repeat protein
LYGDNMAAKIIGYEFYRRFYADVENQRVLRDGDPLPVALTNKEFDILKFFLNTPQTLIQRNHVEPLSGFRTGRHPLDNYLSHINSKLGLEKNELFVLTRGAGYTLDSGARAVSASDRLDGGEFFKISDQHFNTHTVDSMRASLKQTLRALEMNPHGLPEAHITAAYDYINLSQAAYSAEPPKKAMLEARRHATEAQKEKSTVAAACGVLGLISLIYDYDWSKSEASLKKALELDPNEASTLLSYAHLRVSSGLFQEGLEAVERAARIDPTDRIIYASVGWMHLFAGNTDEAVELGEKTVFLYPDLPPAYVILGWAYEGAGQYKLAQKNYETSLRKEYAPAALASLGHLLGKTGRVKEASKTLAELDNMREDGVIAYVPSYCHALIYAGLNEKRKCLDALEDAYEERCDWLVHLAVERRWDSVRASPRFGRLVRKIGIPWSRLQR